MAFFLLTRLVPCRPLPAAHLAVLCTFAVPGFATARTAALGPSPVAYACSRTATHARFRRTAAAAVTITICWVGPHFQGWQDPD